MKIYSLYLSTQTGATVGAIFTAMANGTNLYVTSVTSGTIKANQYITINEVINQITAYVANSGTNGSVGIYTLLTSVVNTPTATVNGRINNTANSQILDGFTQTTLTGNIQVGQVITYNNVAVMTYITSYSSNYYVNNTTQVNQSSLSFYNTSTFQSVIYDNGNNIK